MECFACLLEHHSDDEKIVKTCGECLQQVLKLLMFEQIVVKMIDATIPAKAVEVIEFKDTTDKNRELYIDILARLCWKVPEFDKFYEQGVPKMVSAKLAECLTVEWDKQTDAQKQTTELYIRLAAGIASRLLFNFRKHFRHEQITRDQPWRTDPLHV